MLSQAVIYHLNFYLKGHSKLKQIFHVYKELDLSIGVTKILLVFLY